MPNGTWLRTVRAVERDRGVNYTTLACQASVLTPYVRDRLAHAAQGIERVYSQLPYAVMSDEEQRSHWETGREEYVNRICEVLQHLASALSAVGCTDEELDMRLFCKDDANEVESDTHVSSAGSSEEDTCEVESDSGETIVVGLSVEGRTEVPESGN